MVNPIERRWSDEEKLEATIQAFLHAGFPIALKEEFQKGEQVSSDPPTEENEKRDGGRHTSHLSSS